MDYLLDTHTFLWYIDGKSNLSTDAINFIENKRNAKYLSIASLWEISIKLNQDKLSLTQPFESLPTYMTINNFNLLPIYHKHLSGLIDLPYHHKDPFDRLLIAQAIAENLIIISADRHFIQYPVSVIW